MADKLDVNTGGTAAGDKIWDMHQKDEQKAVNNHKEGYCWKLRDFRRAGGSTSVDPFWKSMRRSMGKDYLFKEGFTRHFRK